MKFPRLPTLKLPKWIFNIRFPKLFQNGDSQKAFYNVWKKFIWQIPPESRSTINSYQHFIVLGYGKSGKSDLIQGLTEQSQDLYPFDTSYTADPDIQFHLGPNQVIQELSFASLEDRSVKVRKKTIRLWKKLYARRDPTVIITYNCFSKEYENLRDLNRLAQLIAGKISLLSEITKKPLKVRIALTHLDKMQGYLEFARFLKQENLTFNISLSSNFESNTLEMALRKFFEDHLNLMLTSSSSHAFSKMLTFSKEMLVHFHTVEEFLRALVTRVSFSSSIELDTLSFTSNQESSTSFSPFQWSRQASMEIFFRYPMLKHQLASACLVLLSTSVLLSYYFQERKELNLAQKGIDQLNLLEFSSFQDQVIPEYVSSLRKQPSGAFAYLTPHFFGGKLEDTKNALAGCIQRHYIDREFRKAILGNKGELKHLYFVSLMHATSNNHLGRFIIDHSQAMADAINIPENLLVAYVNSTTEYRHLNTQHLGRVNPFSTLTSFLPWSEFLRKIQEISSQPIFIDHDFEEIVSEAERLLMAVNHLQNNFLPFGLATLLEEQKGVENISENIQVIRWIGENSDILSNFLSFIKVTSVPPIDIEGLNITQFFAKIKKMSAMTNRENQTYNFTLNDQYYSFDTKTWMDLVVAHNVERAIQKYIASNNNTHGDIFFRETREAPEPVQPLSVGAFPFFADNVTIPGRYTRLEYENKVRSSAENLYHLVDSLTVNPEEKRRFNTFLIHELINYMKYYQECYAKYFDSCDIQATSLEGLKGVLHNMTCESSNFHDFLRFIQHQTGAFSEVVLTLKNMNELNQFGFLNHILTLNEGKAPFTEYQEIIANLLADLDGNYASADPVLDPYLTNVGRISLDIVQNNSNSYVNRIRECLTKLGVPERYQGVFQKPVLQLNKIGVVDLKKAIEEVWSTNFQSKIDELFLKFPFNFAAAEAASFEEVNRMLNPTAEFYKEIVSVMNTYEALAKLQINQEIPLGSKMHLDQEIFTSFDQIKTITDFFWDREGNPKSIKLHIKPIPFTVAAEKNPVVVYSYLVVGNQSVRNLNQAPAWQTIAIDWWKEDNTSVGVELMNRSTNSRTFKSIQKLNSKWGFFELLKEAAFQENNVLTWKIANEDETCDISLCFENNPMQLLAPKKADKE